MAVKAKDLARALRHARNAHSRLYESTPDVEGERPSTYLGVEGPGLDEVLVEEVAGLAHPSKELVRALRQLLDIAARKRRYDTFSAMGLKASFEEIQESISWLMAACEYVSMESRPWHEAELVGRIAVLVPEIKEDS